MGELRSFPGKKQDDEDTCPFCHPSYPCHGKKFGQLNCPRVAAFSFLDWEQVHEDGWYIGAVQFRDEIVLEADIPPEEGAAEESE